MWHLKPIPPKNLKILINTGLGVALASLVTSGWNDFQRLKVYEVSTGLQNQPNYKVVTKQFDRQTPTIPANSKVIAEINQAFPYLKIAFAVGGVVVSGLVIFGCHYEETNQSVNEYVELKTDELRKIEIDTNVAAQHKVAQEKAVLQAMELVGELMKNPHYRRLQEAKQKIEYGEDDTTDSNNETTEDDTDTSWNPFLEEPTKTESNPQSLEISESQINEIKKAYKESPDIEAAIAKVLNLKKGDANFLPAIKQIAALLKK